MNSHPLRTLGWKPCFEQQLSIEEESDHIAVRVGAHLGSQILCMTASGETTLPIGLVESCGELAVGDWLLLDPETRRGVRRLEREPLIARRAAGERTRMQPIAANVDTLFIMSSCNHDFNLSRLERYLAVATEAEVTPGMRELQLTECDTGVAEVFEEIIALAQGCQFRDCSHDGEPGCAVQASIESGELDQRRLKNYRKLQSEQARNAQSLREQRHQSRKRGQFYKSVIASKRNLRDQ